MTNHPKDTLFTEPPLGLLRAYAEMFIHRRDCYPMQLDKGSYVTIKKPLELHLVSSHIKGLVTLGAYALDEKSIARWVCVDADDDNQWQQLKAMAERLADLGVSAYLETSRRGGHLWLFTPPLPGKGAREFGQQLLADYDLDPEKIEIFPKQTRLKTGVGSLVRLPLGVHRKTGRRYHFIHPDGQPLAPTIREQIKILGKPDLVPESFIKQVVAKAREKLPSPSSPPEPTNTPIFAKGESLSERIKSAISVYDFVSRYVELDQNGRGLCPFHDDEHQSFGVNIGSNYWSCYAGCGGGSVIDFWMKWREKQGLDSSFKATIKDLAITLLSD